MSNKREIIKLKDIEVNKENFRHSPLENEKEAIHYLIKEDYKSYFSLAESMKKDCRTFTALVLKRDDKMILMDANRRISVLKIFEDPSLIPLGREYDKLRELCSKNGSFGINEIYADVYDNSNIEDKENLMNALDEMHVNDNNTRKDWNALSQYRASKFIGSTIKHSWIKVLEYYKYSDDKIIQMTKDRTDIFNRILKKQKLCIDAQGKINLNNDKFLIEKICKIVKDRSYYLNGNVVKVNTRSKVEIYDEILDDLINQVSIGQEKLKFEDENIDEEKEKDSIGNKNDDSAKNGPIKHENSDPNKKPNGKISLKPSSGYRSYIMSDKQKEDLSMTSNEKVNRMAYELSSMSMDKYIVSLPILLRSFLQYSFEWYMKNIMEKSNCSGGLSANIMSVANWMFEKNYITREEKATVKVIIQNTDVINLLNSATHDYSGAIISKTILSDLYDAIHPLIKIIYFYEMNL